jgi:hypothetical protein
MNQLIGFIAFGLLLTCMLYCLYWALFKYKPFLEKKMGESK